MGGMTSNGRSWQLSLSPEAPFSSDDAANNVLEFIALAITLKTEIDELKKQKLTEEVILALSDNTSAIHWVFKTGRVQQNSKYFQVTNFVARSIATWLMQSNNFICTQHIPGIHKRICEVVKTSKPGLTKRLKLRNIVFRDANLTVIAHDEDILLAEFVTLVFEDQKNGKRLERRTQRRTSDPSLCPVLRLGRAVLRTLRFWIGANANTCYLRE